MSSVPVQFLVYILPEPTCPTEPIIIPLQGCLEVAVGSPKNFTIFVQNLCNPNTIKIVDMIVSPAINGMQMSNLTQVPTNSSLYYVTFTWTPQASQIGLQEMCMVAYTR